jgi:Flp pilus assembly protein TadG
MRRRSERGQAMVLAALMITVLIGFVGLVIDGGEAANEQQIVRSAADGAALAGVYAISKGSTTAAATIAAQQVLVAVPLPTTDLTMSYLDIGGSPTIVTASVVTVRAVVADSHRTFFLAALGRPTITLTATAEAKNGSSGVAAACAVCLMATSGTALAEGFIIAMTVNGGPLQVNADLTQNAWSTLTAPSIVVTGTVTAAGTITPAPVSGAAIPDPLAAIPVPAVAGSAAAPFTAPPGTSALPAGIYSTVTVPAGSTLTLTGTYVITGQFDVNGGIVSGAGVTLFLACTAYPAACAVGASGGFITATSGSLTLSPPTLGAYAGLTVFADRNNVAGDIMAGAPVNVTGTWYALRQPLSMTTSGVSDQVGQLVIASLGTAFWQTFTATRGATDSYGTITGGSLGLTL